MAETKSVKKKLETKAARPAEAAEAPEQTLNVSGAPRNNAVGLRIGAIVLWVLAVACEVLTILMLRGTMYVNPEHKQMFLIGGLVLDLLFVIIGSQLWKAANHKSPASKSNAIKFWLWNNMGVIVAVICFVPLIIFLLRDKELDPKTKKLVTIVAAAALLIAGAASYDYKPVAKEDFTKDTAATMQSMGDGSGQCYWTRFGKSYHLDKNCQTLTRTSSANLFNGTVDEAYDAHRIDPCDFCAGGKEVTDKPETEQPAA
ncbi:MAG: hypothetical protein RR998_01335 [Oscillospiraceae bacterium]